MNTPELSKADFESLREWIVQLPNVTQGMHRFGGTEFRVNGLEFMHSHGHAHLDIRLSKQDQVRVLKDGKVEEHKFAPQAGWVTFIIRSQDDIARAKEIIALAYANAKKTVAARSNWRGA